MDLSDVMKWYDFKENYNALNLNEKFKADATEKFDYVLLQDDIEKIEIAKKHLKPNGTILLFLNNRFGIRYFAGDKQNGKAFDTICSENCNLYSKKEIEQILQNHGFQNYKFFYPLPNYENPSVIFSDSYLPDYTDTKLLYNNLYPKNTALVFQELQALKQLTKAGEFAFFANSYIVEINPKEQPKFVSFNHSRKKEFQLATKMYEKFVVKEMANENAKEHILNMQNYIQELQNHDIKIIDKAENDKIISRFVQDKTLFQKIVEMIKNHEIEKACEKIGEWYNFLKTKFAKDKTEEFNQNIADKNQLSSGLMIVKKAYIDLVLENVFVENNEFVFFDQEWCFENLPLEFILYRAMNNLYIYNFEIEEIFPKEDCLKRFGLGEFVALFEEIEKAIQNRIIDNESVRNFNQTPMVEDVRFLLDERNQLSEMCQGLQQAREELFQTNQEMEFLIGEQKQQIAEKDKYIEKLETYEKDKDGKIENLQETLGLVKVDNEKKQEYIHSLEEYKQEKERENQELNEIIQNLNEIIQVKDNQIQNYENMKAVKLTNKLRGLKK